MIDFRLYRAAFLPAIVAAIAVAFSLEGTPEPLQPAMSPAGYEPGRALRVAHDIVDAAPSRAPGSEGDAAAADLVERNFDGVQGGVVSEQRFEASYGGDDVPMRNVILTLPGESERSIVIIAGRDSPRGPGAASSAAATGVLVELADVLGAADHTKSLVLVSADGASAGAAGAREFAESFPGRDSVDGVVVVAQPGAQAPSEPFVVTSSIGAQSTSIQLVRTAGRAVGEAVGRQPDLEGLFSGLARLALPAGLGQQAVLIDAGLDAVAISSAGEAPLPAADDEVGDISGRSVSDFGLAAFTTVLALDADPDAPLHGPDSYLVAGGNLLPGGPLSLLALALLVPAGAAVVDALARAGRRRLAVGAALRWALVLVVPLLVARLLLSVVTAVGVVPSPDFPFDPALYAIGVGEVIAILVVLGVAVGGYRAFRLLRAPTAADPAVLASALGALLVAGALLAWLSNPFLGLALVAAAHVWILPASRPLARGATVLAVVVALVPALLVLVDVAGAVGLDPWDLTLMVADGQIGSVVTFSTCVIVAALLGLVAAAGAAPVASDPGPAP
jgi:hypothetical protein